MLYARAMGRHLEKQYPDILQGFTVAEALQDYPDEKTVHGVRLAPLEHPENDPILDLLPAGATIDALEDHMEALEAAPTRVEALSDDKKSAILARLEANDAAQAADPSNAVAEGEDADQLALAGID